MTRSPRTVAAPKSAFLRSVCQRIAPVLTSIVYNALVPLSTTSYAGTTFVVPLYLDGMLLTVECTRFGGDPQHSGSPISCAAANGLSERSRRGTRKLRTDQSESYEEQIVRERDRGDRTYILFNLEICINNLSGTDGCRVLCHQFSISSLPRLENSISRCTTCWWKMNSYKEATLLFSSADGQARNIRTTVFPLRSGRLSCSV